MGDLLSDAIESLVAAIVGHRLDYLASYPCKVVAQNGDGTLELQPDDARLSTYSRVPIRYGVPGVSAQVQAGARVMLEFAGADPRKPVATVWESASVTLLLLAGTTGMQGAGLGANLRTELDALWSAIYGGHTHPVPGVTVGGGSTTSSAAAGVAVKQTVESSIVKVKP